MPEENLSGLDEAGIDAVDLEKLRNCFSIRDYSLSGQHDAALGLAWPAAPQFRTADLNIRAPRSLADRLLASIGLGANRKLKIPPFHLQLHHDLDAALQQRVTRSRIFADDLEREQAERMYSQIYDRFGEPGQQLKVVAVYRNVPPECAGSISVERNLAQASFTPGSGAGRSFSKGYFLVVLREESGKLRRVLFRLA